MNFFSKDSWYDWGGANSWLFVQINSIHSNTYDLIMTLLSRVGDRHNFPFYLVGLAVFAMLYYSYRKIRRYGGTSHLISAWCAAFIMLIGGFALEAFVVHYAKDYFSYPRPYMVEHNVEMLELRPADDNYHSFPSGHVAFITLMVIGLWPVLSNNMKCVGALLILGVAWSRMALGMHYPADVVETFLITWPILAITQHFLYRFLRQFAKLKC